MICPTLKNRVAQKEVQLLSELRVEERLTSIMRVPGGMGLFSEVFYFIRYDFCRLNFIVGAKCPPHEMYWSGLVKNLLEELGGGRFKTHNELYREFLFETTGKTEGMLSQPAFAEEFNRHWEDYCLKSSYKHGLLAIGLYEVLDNPDYQLLFSCVKSGNLSAEGAKFFVVHAQAEHYEIFEDIIEEIDKGEGTEDIVEEALEFVIDTQQFMWSSLLSWLEKNLTIVLARMA